MKFKFIYSNEKEEIIVYSKKKTPLIKTIEDLCLESEKKLYGYYNSVIKELDVHEIECFITCNDKVYAIVGNIQYLVKKRLYELSEIYDSYIYINQGCLVNIKMIDHFQTNIGGALLVVFKSGYKDYVSRRRLKEVKERLGIK